MLGFGGIEQFMVFYREGRDNIGTVGTPHLPFMTYSSSDPIQLMDELTGYLKIFQEGYEGEKVVVVPEELSGWADNALKRMTEE
jgi:hypothetical protein